MISNARLPLTPAEARRQFCEKLPEWTIPKGEKPFRMFCEIVNQHDEGDTDIVWGQLIDPFRQRSAALRNAIQNILDNLPALLEQSPTPPAAITQLFTCFATEEERQAGERLLSAAQGARNLFEPPQLPRRVLGGALPDLLRRQIYSVLALDPAARCPEGVVRLVLWAVDHMGYPTEENASNSVAALSFEGLKKRFQRDIRKKPSVL